MVVLVVLLIIVYRVLFDPSRKIMRISRTLPSHGELYGVLVDPFSRLMENYIKYSLTPSPVSWRTIWSIS